MSDRSYLNSQVGGHDVDLDQTKNERESAGRPRERRVKKEKRNVELTLSVKSFQVPLTPSTRA